MDVSLKFKLLALVIIIAALVIGIGVGGPKFFNALQMHIGAKGKIELIDRCIEMPGCSIGPNDLDFYDKYHAIKESDAIEKLKESEVAEKLLEDK
jgi:hypothetical protein